MKSKVEAPLTPKLLQRYAINDEGSHLEAVLQNNGGKIPSGGLISVKSSRNGVKPEREKGSHKSRKKRCNDVHVSSLSKRRS
jgi:N-acetyltransferase 10